MEKPAVQRMKGKSCEQYVLEFGSAVMFRVCGEVEGSCMSERWYSGFWLGKRLGTEVHVVVKEDGAVVRARAVRELERSVTLSVYDHFRGQPHDPTGTRYVEFSVMQDVELKQVKEKAQVNKMTASPRRVFITQEVVRKFGPTPDCRKCRGAMAGDKAYQFVNHSEGCRRRMEALMKEDDLDVKSRTQSDVKQKD